MLVGDAEFDTIDIVKEVLKMVQISIKSVLSTTFGEGGSRIPCARAPQLRKASHEWENSV